jgi:hypothetical protein
MRLRRLIELIVSGRGDAAALEHYYRVERLAAALETHLARDPHRKLSTLERSLYAASSYFAA